MIELLREDEREEEANLYIGIRNCKFGSKINIIDNIKKEIYKENFDYAVTLINQLEKEYISEISADDFAEIAQSFFEKGNYELARKYSNHTLEIYSDKNEAKQLNRIMDFMNV